MQRTKRIAKKNSAKKKRILRVALIVGPLAILAGILFYLHERHYESTDDAFIEAHVIPISARVAGQVTAVHVNDNQTVGKDELLVEIDPSDYAIKKAEQRAKLEAAETEAKRSSLDVKRYQDLYAKDEITQQQLDNAVAQAASETAEVAQERAVVQQVGTGSVLHANSRARSRTHYPQIRRSRRLRAGRANASVRGPAGRLGDREL